ncbi:MAG: hypothetical protein HYY40_08755 [Bacteroidetes bacterium]|nr:hypothetical protein [Bacteroidota bacterium]
MNLPRHLFWDVDYDKLDWEKYASWVIVRVFERGDVDDIRQCRRHYGDEKIKKALLNAKDISGRGIYLAAAVIDEPIQNFRCYKFRQLNPGLFPY